MRASLVVDPHAAMAWIDSLPGDHRVRRLLEEYRRSDGEYADRLWAKLDAAVEAERARLHAARQSTLTQHFGEFLRPNPDS
jgi:hypothetical protein